MKLPVDEIKGLTGADLLERMRSVHKECLTIMYKDFLPTPPPQIPINLEWITYDDKKIKNEGTYYLPNYLVTEEGLSQLDIPRIMIRIDKNIKKVNPALRELALIDLDSICAHETIHYLHDLKNPIFMRDIDKLENIAEKLDKNRKMYYVLYVITLRELIAEVGSFEFHQRRGDVETLKESLYEIRPGRFNYLRKAHQIFRDKLPSLAISNLDEAKEAIAWQLAWKWGTHKNYGLKFHFKYFEENKVQFEDLRKDEYGPAVLRGEFENAN